jgi:hypothetical protein
MSLLLNAFYYFSVLKCFMCFNISHTNILKYGFVQMGHNGKCIVKTFKAAFTGRFFCVKAVFPIAIGTVRKPISRFSRPKRLQFVLRQCFRL